MFFGNSFLVLMVFVWYCSKIPEVFVVFVLGFLSSRIF